MLIPFILISIINTLIGIKLMGLLTPFYKLQKTFVNNNFSHNSSDGLSTRLENVNEKINKSRHKRRSYESITHNIESEITSNNFGMALPMLGISNISERKKKYSKTTKLLLSISTTYLLLHSPLAISKIYYFLKNHHMQNQHFEEQSSSNITLISIDLQEFSNFTAYSDNFNTSYLFNPELEINLTEEIIERIGGYMYYLNFPLNFFLYALNGKKFRDKFLKIFERRNIQTRRWCIRV